MSCTKSRKGFSKARATEKRAWQQTSKFIIKAKRAALNVMSDPTGLHRLGTTNMQRCFDRFRSHFEAAARADNQMLCDVDPNIAKDAEPGELRGDGPDSGILNL